MHFATFATLLLVHFLREINEKPGFLHVFSKFFITFSLIELFQKFLRILNERRTVWRSTTFFSKTSQVLYFFESGILWGFFLVIYI